MSATNPEQLDLEEQVSRIRRSNEETRKFVAEQHKLMAEAAKFQRDTTVAPWLAAGAVAGGILTAATLLMRALGIL